MERTLCSEGCGRPTWSTGLCKPCYERKRRDRVKGPPAAERQCAHCGGLMVNRTHRDAKYCSPVCKEAARPSRYVPVPAVKGGTGCEICGEPLPRGRAKFCSRKCLVTAKNRAKAAAKRTEKITAREPCRRCGGPIPPERFASAVYCSYDCKKKANDAAWRARSPHYNRQYLYGITPEQWQAQLEAQDHRCAICRTDEWPGKDNRPHADHDHSVAVFRLRGILCYDCNLMLGRAHDDPLRLAAAIVYLTRDDPARLAAAAEHLETALAAS